MILWSFTQILFAASNFKVNGVLRVQGIFDFPRNIIKHFI